MALASDRVNKLRGVALNLFQKKPDDAAGSTQFAATMIAMPGDVPGGGWAPPDSSLQDSSLHDSSLTDSAVGDTSSAGHAVPDVVTDFGGLPVDAPDPAVEPTLSHIGRYALKRQLGEGGLGAVYEAWDPLLSRAVAVKTLQFDVDARARVSLDGLFLNEARAAAGLTHKYIVTIHDAGLSAHGVYIAMERLYGRDLQQALVEGWRPTLEQSVQLVRRIAEALAYAHARGVVHCDIKPANIFLTRRAKPKVLDFGIARVTHGTTLKMLDGTVAGSPRYRAPEQLAGGTIDARTDMFSLGAVFYELLCGEKAFEGTSLADINQAVLDSRPKPAHEVRPSVPEDLSKIVSRMMAREPEHRFAGANDVVSALRRWSVEHAAGAEMPLPHRQQGVEAGESGTRRRWLMTAALFAAAGAIALGLNHRTAPVDPAAPPAPAPVAATPLATAAAPAVPSTPTAPVDPGAAASSAAAEVAPSLTATAPAPSPAAATAAVPAPTSRTRNAADNTGARRVPVADALARETRPIDTSPAVAAPPLQGLVQLAVSPWGQIEVDGQAAGATPPLSRLSLNEGNHTITVRNADFPAYTVQVQVSADKPVTIRHRFGS